MASAFPVSKSLITGEAGAIEVAAHVSDVRMPLAIAVVAHPHPLFGGSMDNKVATTLARATPVPRPTVSISAALARPKACTTMVAVRPPIC